MRACPPPSAPRGDLGKECLRVEHLGPLHRRSSRRLRLALLRLCLSDPRVAVTPQVVLHLELLRLHRVADALVLRFGDALGVVEALAHPAQLLPVHGRQVGREPSKGPLEGLGLIAALLDEQAVHAACERVERRMQQLDGIGRRRR